MERLGSLFLVDRDRDSRDIMAERLRTLGWKVETFATLADYLRQFAPLAPGCLLLKDFLDADGRRQLQERKRRGHTLQPVIFIPDEFDVDSTLDVFRLFTFLLKKSVGVVDSAGAVEGSTASETNQPPVAQLDGPSDDLLAATTPRERRILALLCAGAQNKQIFRELGLPLRSLQRIKSALFERLRIESPLDLVRINDRLTRLPDPR